MHVSPLSSPELQAISPPEEMESPRGCKRRRQMPVTPPATIDDPEGVQILKRAVSVLTTEATALSFVSRLYQTNPTAQSGLLRAVDCIVNLHETGGKLIICGIGKSGYVGMKIVATFKSLGISSSFLHAAEALHGDLGDIKKVCAYSEIISVTASLRVLERRAHVHYILWSDA